MNPTNSVCCSVLIRPDTGAFIGNKLVPDRSSLFSNCYLLNLLYYTCSMLEATQSWPIIQYLTPTDKQKCWNMFKGFETVKPFHDLLLTSSAGCCNLSCLNTSPVSTTLSQLSLLHATVNIKNAKNILEIFFFISPQTIHSEDLSYIFLTPTFLNLMYSEKSLMAHFK